MVRLAIPPKLIKHLGRRAGSAVDIAVEERMLVLRLARSPRRVLRRKLRRCDEAALAAGEKNLAEGVSPAEALTAGAAVVEAR